jgi:hypothetical protein
MELLYCNSLINPLNAELKPTCHLLALLEAHPILHISRIRVKALVFRMSSNNKPHFSITVENFGIHISPSSFLEV